MWTAKPCLNVGSTGIPSCRLQGNAETVSRVHAQGEPKPRRAQLVSDSDDDGAAARPRRALAIESDDEDSDTSHALPAGQQMRTAIDLTRDGEPSRPGYPPSCSSWVWIPACSCTHRSGAAKHDLKLFEVPPAGWVGHCGVTYAGLVLRAMGHVPLQ